MFFDECEVAPNYATVYMNKVTPKVNKCEQIVNKAILHDKILDKTQGMPKKSA